MMKFLYNTIDNVVLQYFEEQPEFECWECTPELEQQLIGKVKPQIVNGIVIETATPEEIELYFQRLVPQEVSAARFWLAVFELWGIKKSDVLTIIDTLQEPTATRIKIMIEASVFERSNPMLLMVAQIFEKTSQELNEVFTTANQPLNV